MKDNRVKIYDTTLRDGTQGEDVSFSVGDKVRIARALDELGISYIEGGWPGSNPRDAAFFEAARGERLTHAKFTAFGSTRRSGVAAADDPLLKALLAAGTPVACIFGKSWTLHVRDALGVSLEENLELVFDTVAFLKKHFDEVIYDAEHFFDGYADNPEYALSTLKSAKQAGADVIVLCDTNGGTMSPFLRAAIAHARKVLPDAAFGIHAHNDSEVAVANTLVAVEGGARHVQGTINGFGERCGNANLVSIIPNLQLKLGYECVPAPELANLKRTSRLVFEFANQIPNKRQAYVGDSAFAHKGGIHVSAVVKNARTYEHIEPETVGNVRRVLVSDLSGRSNVLYKAKEW
ncbi:MAG TPA: citramalate synthase, partial [Polyangiaceae bacterium]|nr:citramalate synthase [Polyangiaceae bacterium]